MDFESQRGLVLSGTTLLLVLPALILSASFLMVVSGSEESTSVSSLSDKAIYTASDIKRTIRGLKESGRRVDSEVLNKVAKKYRDKTIFDNIQLNFTPFDIRQVVYDGGGTYEHTSHSKFCEIKNLGPNRWYYNFEDLETWNQNIDKDFNEPLLEFLRLDNGDWKVTVKPTYSGGYTVTIYWDNKGIFYNINHEPDWENARGNGGVDTEGRWEGESRILSGDRFPSSAKATVVIEDPNGIVHYEETFSISTSGGISGGGGGGGGPSNESPTADANGPYSVDEGNSISLNGSGSSDPDGSIVSYSWTITNDSGASLSNANTANPTFEAPNNVNSDTDVTVELTVTDDNGATDSTTATVTVNDVPGPTADLRLQYEVPWWSDDPYVNRIAFNSRIINDGSSAVDLDDVTFRYWFSSEPSGSDVYVCYWADVGSDGVAGSFGSEGGNHYLEVEFTSDASVPPYLGGNWNSSLPAGASTGDIVNSVRDSNWDTYNQTDDYSFNPSYTSYRNWENITVYYQGNLVWGTPPS